MNAPFARDPEFRRLLAGDPAVDLTAVAFEVARDAHPGLDPARYLARIEGYVDRVRDRCASGTGIRAILGQINWVLFVEEQFKGDVETYYDPRNSYLNTVMDRRLGIPISLSVLYMAVADRLGLLMSGVNLPGHFVLRTGTGPGTIFVDPYHGGHPLDREACGRRVAEVTGQAVRLDESTFEPCGTAAIVARMLRNLKGIYLKEHDFASALPILRRLAALQKGDPTERRDLGVACLHADRPGESIGHLEAYLAAMPRADDREVVAGMLRDARRGQAERN